MLPVRPTTYTIEIYLDRSNAPNGQKSSIMSKLPDIYYARSSIIWLRVIASLAWLDSALVGKDAKLSYAFLSGVELAKRISETFVFTAVIPAVTALLQNVVLPNVQFFAIAIGFGDLAIGISLSLGLFTRFGSVLAILRALTNILVAGGAGPDTVGFNVMLIAAGAI